MNGAALIGVERALRPTFAPARGILARYILLRLLLCTALFSLALISVVDRPWTLLTTQILFYLAAVAYFFMGTSAFLLPAFGTRGWFVWAQLVFDTAMVTALVYLTGSTSSPFFVLYFMNLLAAAWMLPQMGVIIVTLIDALAFSSLIAARLATRQDLGSRDASEVIIEVLSIVLVGALASVLSGRITSAKNELIENAELTQRLIDDHDQILNQVPAGIVTVDAAGAIDSVNPAAFAILGPVVGRPIAEIVPGQGRRWEHVYARGTTRRFLLCNQTTRRQGGFVVSIEDVTRMRQIEAELAREERLAAVGRLAAGLAHEIRNPLASLSGAVQLLGEKSPEPLFDIVLREVHRINELVEEFLDTARPLKLSIAQVDAASLVRDVVGAFRNDPRYRDRVAIHVDCDGKHRDRRCRRVPAEPGPLESAVERGAVLAGPVPHRRHRDDARSLLRARGARRRAGHPAREPGADLRSVLHDAIGWHGPRSGERPPDRARARRNGRRRERRRRRRAVHPPLPARAGAGPPRGYRRQGGGPTLCPVSRS